MREILYTWFSALRVRLIITLVLVTALSFFLLLLLLMDPVKEFLIAREEASLRAIAITLASTISTPEADNDAFRLDLGWTQRRCHEFLRNQLTGTRFRVVDAEGDPLIDSAYRFSDSKNVLKDIARFSPSLRKYPEVIRAMHGVNAFDVRLYNEKYNQRYFDSAVAPDQPGGSSDDIGIFSAFSNKESTKNPSHRIYVATPVLRWSKSKSKSKLCFIMLIDKPLDAVYDNLNDVRGRIRKYMYVSLLATILVSILLSSHISSRLQAATGVARAFAAGNMSIRMRVHDYDEVGQLGKAFNQMADALQRQEQLRRDLLADVSHELRTPLTAITGCADTLSEGVLREDPVTAQHFLTIILRESKRLHRLVSDILELSRLQGRAIVIPLKAVNLCPVIEDAVEITRMHIRHDHTMVQCRYPEGCPENPLYVLGNEDRIGQALRNLLDNAQHHTPDGHAITIEADISDAYVVVHVRDKGQGIPPADIPWVFDRFYRAGKGENKPSGTGLGLAIVREIMYALEGKVTVESELGCGTTFSLHFRRVPVDDPSTADG